MILACRPWDARKAEYARQERIVDQARARHWLADGQKGSDEETAARKRKAFAESGCQPLKWAPSSDYS